MIFEDFDFCSPSVVNRLVGDAALRTMTVVIHGRRYDSFSDFRLVSLVENAFSEV